MERYPVVEAERERNEIRLKRGGTEQNLRFSGSVTEVVENEFSGTLFCRGCGSKQNLSFGEERVAERYYPAVDPQSYPASFH